MGKRILFVCGDDVAVATYIQALKLFGHTTVLCKTAKEAEHAVRQNSEGVLAFDILIWDPLLSSEEREGAFNTEWCGAGMDFYNLICREAEWRKLPQILFPFFASTAEEIAPRMKAVRKGYPKKGWGKSYSLSRQTTRPSDLVGIVNSL